jgi:hypothetical protein
MTARRVPSDGGVTEQVTADVPEADAAEQQAELVDVSDRATGLDDERVVALDEDEYR